MTSYVTPKSGTAYKFYVGLIDQSNTKLLKANPTIAAGDFKVSTDGGAFANLATLPSANPASGRAVMIDLSSGEMTGANIVVQCVDAAGAEWCDLMVSLQTTTRQIDDLAYPATSGRSIVVDASGLVDANAVKLGPSGSGTALTAKDIGASVLLSSGTGTGQLDFTSGVVKANATQWLGGTIPAVTVTGVPLVDLKYTLGTLSPAAAGSVGVDWAQVANKTSTVGLTGTTISTGQTITSVSGAVGSVTGAVGSVTGSVGSVTGAVGSVTGAVGSVTGAVGSVTGNVGGNVVGSVASVTGAVGSVTAAVTVDGTSALTEAYSTKGGSLTLAQALHELVSFADNRSIGTTIVTVKKRDTTTTAKTLTLDSATAPTSTVRAT